MNSNNIDYQAVLKDLEARKADLESAIQSVKRILGQSVSPNNGFQSSANSSGELAIDAFFGMSIPNATKKFLAHCKKPTGSSKIAEVLIKHGMVTSSKNFKNNVNSVLYRYSKDSGDIVRLHGKEWGLAEWYPGLKKGRRSKADENPQNGGNGGNDDEPAFEEGTE